MGGVEAPGHRAKGQVNQGSTAVGPGAGPDYLGNGVVSVAQSSGEGRGVETRRQSREIPSPAKNRFHTVFEIVQGGGDESYDAPLGARTRDGDLGVVDGTSVRRHRPGVRAGLSKNQIGLEFLTRRFDRPEHRLGREPSEELAVQESRRLGVWQPGRAPPQVFRFRRVGRVTQIMFDAKFLNFFGEARRHDHEDLVTTFTRGLDEGHQGIEMPRQARRTEK